MVVFRKLCGLARVRRTESVSAMGHFVTVGYTGRTRNGKTSLSISLRSGASRRWPCAAELYRNTPGLVRQWYCVKSVYAVLLNAYVSYV